MESLCLRNPKLTNCMHSLIHFSPWGCWVGLAKEVIFPLCCQKEKLLDFFLSVKICRSRKVNSRRLSTKRSFQMSCQRDHSSNKWEQILKAKMRSQSRFWEQRNVRTWSTWAGHWKKMCHCGWTKQKMQSIIKGIKNFERLKLVWWREMTYLPWIINIGTGVQTPLRKDPEENQRWKNSLKIFCLKYAKYMA